MSRDEKTARLAPAQNLIRRRKPDAGPSPLSLPARDSFPDNLYDLAALGRIATRMASGQPETCLAEMLDWLRRSDVEIAEVFLVEPQSGHLVLAMFQGPFQSAFAKMDRFRPGEGFPGLVATSGHPLISRHLTADDRYLRGEVKKLGFQTYVCVPLRGSDNVIGTLHVGSRNSNLDIPRILRLLTWTGVPLGTLMESTFLKARLAVAPITADASWDAERRLSDQLRQALRAMMAVGAARSGTLTLLSRDIGDPVQHVTEGTADAPSCHVSREDFPAGCPALGQRRGVTLSDSPSTWPDACKHISASCGPVQCVPLFAGGQALGIAQVRYENSRDLLPGRHLPALLHMASGAADVINATRTRSPVHPALDEERAATVGNDSEALRTVSVARAHESSTPNGVVPVLDVKCLGSFHIEHGGRQITPQMVQRRGALSLLKLLLRRPGHMFSRDALVEALWPDLDPKLGAQRVYVLIHALRQTIEPPGQGRNWLYIRSEGESYYFNTDAPYALDVQAFQHHVHQGDAEEAAGRTAAAIACYESAIALYRGDYLEDELYADWAWEEREQLRELYLAALGCLAEGYWKAGACERSIACYQRALRADPLREKTCRELMMALWRTGRRVEALRVYEAFCSTLESEVGIRPMRDTQDLYACIRADSSQ